MIFNLPHEQIVHVNENGGDCSLLHGRHIFMIYEMFNNHYSHHVYYEASNHAAKVEKMKVSREQVTKNRQNILDAAGRLFRERGFDAISVSEVMKAAGLTHGGFYGYFKSKEDLIAHALTHLMEKDTELAVDPVAYAAAYLSPEHRDDLAGGCPTAALAAETVRQSPEVRAVMAEIQRRTFEKFKEGLRNAKTDEARRAAIGAWSAMVGALVLARVTDDPMLSDEVLTQTYAWILERKHSDAPG